MPKNRPTIPAWPLPTASYSLVDHFRSMFDEAPERHSYRYLVDGEGEPITLSNAEFDRRCRALAAHLRARHAVGERALIVCPAGIDYVVSFFACLYAGIIAVPVYPPNPSLLKRTLPRLLAILDDAGASCVLAPADITGMVDAFAEYAPRLRELDWVSVDQVDAAEAEVWRHPAVTADDIAFLQYTSGSTSTPKGVMVGHGNLLHNITRINEQLFGAGEGDHMVTWLPPYHDMGLIAGLLAPAVGGYPVTFMSPFSFLKRPRRWLDAIARHGGTISGGPNFAFELCVSKLDDDDRARLDLSTWKVAFNGAEPVRASTLERFAETFAGSGFRRDAFEPAYGLAEGTLAVSAAGRPEAGFVQLPVSAQALSRHQVIEPRDDTDRHVLVGCGRPMADLEVAIADPETREALPDRQVGEVWVQGPSVAHGYWQRPEQSEETFRARLAGSGHGPYLRTGDLGYLDGGEVYITGRIKDVLIIDGVNHYPQDIERTMEAADPALRKGCGVAGVREIDGEDRILLIQEVGGSRADLDLDRVMDDIRGRVIAEHGLAVHHVALVGQGKVPKTSSGKLQRAACLDALVAGDLETLAEWSQVAVVPPATRGVPAPDVDAADIAEMLTAELATALKVDAGVVDRHAPFASLGLRSVELVSAIGRLERELGRPLPATLAYEHPTIERLATFLADGEAERSGGPDDADGADAAPVGTSGGHAADDAGACDQPIAVVGVGCRFPGGAHGPEQFWRLLRDGTDAITEVPAERWNVDDVFDPDPDAPGKTDTRWGGFVPEVDRFDHEFFRISQHEASRMDPQQRLLAETTWEALEDAGVPASQLAGTCTGVFVGISSFDYANQALADLSDVDAYTGTGSALSIAANRLSYLLDLRGPSMAVDTACSSSLVAVLQACAALRAGDCEAALAGGVNLILSPAFAVNFSKAGMMSADGRCKPFDASADGFVRAEGVGMVVLKPLEAALSDGDAVYGVIRGGAINQDGRSNGINAPNPAAQEAVLRAAYAQAGVPADRVDYVEAHGTGTMLGDPIEATALGAVVGRDRDGGEPCLIGSVKSNVGHMEAAAGIGGLIKAALMLRHRHVPRTVHYREPNPHIAFDELGIAVADQERAWPSEGRPGVIGVSSFGFGGTNAHVVLEEAPAPAERPEVRRRSQELVTVSADSVDALRDLARRYRDLATTSDAALSEVAAAAAVRRDHHSHRLACVAGSMTDLAEQLTTYLDDSGGEGDGPVTGGPAGRARRTAFVFSGQGSQWWPLAAELLETEPLFRSVLDRCDGLLGSETDWSLLRELTVDGQESRLNEEAVRQPALCAVQIALATLWRSWGVEPAAVVGHSIGEVAAAHVSGALSLGDALRVALHRGRSTDVAARDGAVAVVGLDADRTRGVLAARSEAPLWFAGSNSPYRSLIGGAHGDVADLVAELEAGGDHARVLDSPAFASHTPMMESAAAELWPAVSGIRPRASVVPMYSTVSGGPVDGAGLDGEYWAENLTRPVLFEQAVAGLARDGFDTFVEIAPHPRLGDAVTETVEAGDQGRGADVVVVGSLRRDDRDTASLLRALGTLYAAGHRVDFRRVHAATVPHVALPTYAWQGRRCWLEQRSPRRARGRSAHPALQADTVSAADPGTTFWTSHVDAAEFGYLADHVVGGATVVPGAFLLDAVLAGARRSAGFDDVVVRNVRFHRPVILADEATEPTMQLIVSDAGSGTGTLRLFSRQRADAEAPWQDSVSGEYVRGTVEPEDRTLDQIRGRCRETVDVAGHYAALRAAGLEYGAAFQGIAQLVSGDGEALATLRDAAEIAATAGGYGIHPALLDSGVQALVAALGEARDDIRVPAGVERFALSAAAVVPRFAHAVLGEEDSRTGDLVGCRVTFYDDAGAVVGELAGLRLSRVESPAGGVDESARDVLQLRWNVTPADEAGAELPPGWWLIVGDGADADEVTAELERRGASCVSVPAGTDDPATTLAGLVRTRTEPCAGVIHTCGTEQTGTGSPAELATDLAERVRTLLVAVTETMPEAPRFVVLTRGAQRVTDDDAVPGLAQAPLWGLVRVAILEHGELRPLIVDLDPDGRDGGRRVIAELGRTGNGQVALRGEQRYTAALDRWRRPDEDGTEWARRRFHPERSGHHRILAERPGILGSLTPVRTSPPEVAEGEVAVEVAATGLNFSDVLKAMGVYPGAEGVVPLGAECSGRVTAVGPGVTAVAAGDPVMAVGPAAMATSMTTDARLVAPRPAELSDDEAAAVPIAFLTALYGLEYCARLRRGETVLIHSATGGVGLAALQIARRRGATVYATAGTDSKRALLAELGVEHVMDSRSLDFADDVARLTGGRGVDVVLNSVSGEALVRGVEVLAPGGRFVEIGKRDIYDGSRLSLELFKHNRSFVAVDLEEMFRGQRDLVAELFTEVSRGFADGEFTALPVTAFDYAAAAEAFQTMARARHTGKLVVTAGEVSEVAERPSTDGVRPHGTYLVTGGLGALGLATARYLVDQGARHLLLLGRRAPSGEAAATIEALRERGATVDVRSVDVTDYDDVATVIADCEPEVVGVVHAAGAVDDGLLGDLDAERMRSVADPKVRGAWNLHEATAGQPVELFVLYSSAAALLGSMGQGNYAAANTFLDALAEHRRAAGLPGLSVAWGPWSGEGMATRTGAGEVMAAKGVRVVEPDAGVAALDTLLRTATAHASVLPLDLPRLREHAGDETLSPLLREFAGAAAGDGGPGDGVDADVRAELLAVEPGRRRRRILATHCAETAARVLKVHPGAVDPAAPLSGAGLDSLLALELRKRLERSLGIGIPPTFTWRFPSIDALVPFLAERMAIPLDSAENTAERTDRTEDTREPGAGDVDEAALDEMSEAELQQLLLAKTQRIDERIDEGLSR